jgi:hypothetical protein
MSLALPLLLGLAVAPLLGGSWRALGRLHLAAVPLFYAAIPLQVVAFPAERLPWRTPDGVAIGLWLTSYALFTVGLVRNARIPGVPLVAAGLVSNVMAIVVNRGHMPALPSALRAAGLHFSQNRNSIASVHPHLAVLVDRWAVPAWIPWGNVFSVGDVCIALGGLLFALAATDVFRGFGRRTPGAGPRARNAW